MATHVLFDDDYRGPRFTYGLTFRPPRTGAVPAGWIIGSHRPSLTFAHGTVDYPRLLTDAEIAGYELTPAGSR